MNLWIERDKTKKGREKGKIQRKRDERETERFIENERDGKLKILDE